MEQQAYLTSAKEILSLIDTAMEEAKVLLPESVIKQHWMAAKHSPNAWAYAHQWFLGQPDCDDQLADVASDLVLLSRARACLATITQAAEGPPPLRLVKCQCRHFLSDHQEEEARRCTKCPCQEYKAEALSLAKVRRTA